MRLPESWTRPIEPGEMNPISVSILRTVRRGAFWVAAIWLSGGVAHFAERIFMAGWRWR